MTFWSHYFKKLLPKLKTNWAPELILHFRDGTKHTIISFLLIFLFIFCSFFVLFFSHFFVHFCFQPQQQGPPQQQQQKFASYKTFCWRFFPNPTFQKASSITETNWAPGLILHFRDGTKHTIIFSSFFCYIFKSLVWQNTTYQWV